VLSVYEARRSVEASRSVLARRSWKTEAEAGRAARRRRDGGERHPPRNSKLKTHNSKLTTPQTA
jgi:hypothetical protein